jgi:tetratricopeptide (TPR) repeat protein
MQSLSPDPESKIRTLITQAACAHRARQHSHALAIYRAVAKLPGCPHSVHYDTAVQLRALNLHQEALASLVEFLRHETDNFRAWTNAGDSLREMHKDREALVMFQRALACASQEPRAHKNLAAAHNNVSRAYWAGADLDKAIAHARMACDLDPTDPECAFGLFECLQAAGLYAESWPYFEARHAKHLREQWAKVPDQMHREFGGCTTQVGSPLTTEHDTAHSADVGASEASP